MRMSVSIGRFAVSGPAGVGDTEGAGDRIALQPFLQQGDLALGTHDLDLPVGSDHGDSGTVITAIFKPFQTLNEDPAAVTTPHIAYDATHAVFSSLIGTAIARTNAQGAVGVIIKQARIRVKHRKSPSRKEGLELPRPPPLWVRSLANDPLKSFSACHKRAPSPPVPSRRRRTNKP